MELEKLQKIIAEVLNVDTAEVAMIPLLLTTWERILWMFSKL